MSFIIYRSVIYNHINTCMIFFPLQRGTGDLLPYKKQVGTLGHFQYFPCKTVFTVNTDTDVCIDFLSVSSCFFCKFTDYNLEFGLFAQSNRCGL